jgi:hypothetical protein
VTSAAQIGARTAWWELAAADAFGPETFDFIEFVRLIGLALARPVVPVRGEEPFRARPPAPGVTIGRTKSAILVTGERKQCIDQGANCAS